MTIDTSGQPMTLDGEPFNDERGKLVTFRSATEDALNGNVTDEPGLTGQEKLDRWSLSLRVRQGGSSVELTVEEIALVKKLIAKRWSTPIVGQVWMRIEGKPSSGETMKDEPPKA